MKTFSTIFFIVILFSSTAYSYTPIATIYTDDKSYDVLEFNGYSSKYRDGWSSACTSHIILKNDGETEWLGHKDFSYVGKTDKKNWKIKFKNGREIVVDEAVFVTKCSWPGRSKTEREVRILMESGMSGKLVDKKIKALDIVRIEYH